ncbi:cytochrome c oxidase caa3 assembly factor family protein [Mycobacterium ulcerans str. Harvey]|uniref:Cytochrome c oxidase caa3 assembly factor family protein n=1 Tax=Mycobacterium ulcerans str. Harvey TaxID=1299332 RepID=A0ABN0RB24_MYCUL|nr:cytochrome c oxidase caa3 assembly factor family protein [Mycobacterium ulcerans str. Harvey]
MSWLIGCAVLVITSSSGVRTYGSAMFSVHMAEHMTLNMFIPCCWCWVARHAGATGIARRR